MLLYSILYHFFISSFFFFNDTATTEIYTLSLHDALPISGFWKSVNSANSNRTIMTQRAKLRRLAFIDFPSWSRGSRPRSEEHTSELQSHSDLVCRLLLEKKKKRYQQLVRAVENEGSGCPD